MTVKEPAPVTEPMLRPAFVVIVPALATSPAQSIPVRFSKEPVALIASVSLFTKRAPATSLLRPAAVLPFPARVIVRSPELVAVMPSDKASKPASVASAASPVSVRLSVPPLAKIVVSPSTKPLADVPPETLAVTTPPSALSKRS